MDIGVADDSLNGVPVEESSSEEEEEEDDGIEGKNCQTGYWMTLFST